MSAERAPRKPGSRRVPLTSARSIGWLSIAVVLVISLLRLAGGLLHLTVLISVAPAWTEMKTITMVCFLFSAGALMLIYLRPANSRRSIGAMFLGGIVALIGLVTIADYVSDLVVGRASAVTQAPFLNLFFATQTRMALITAFVFALVGFTLFLLGAGSRRTAHVAHALAFPAAIASYMVLVSYVLGVQSMSAVMGTAMALNTGIAFCFLSLAAFCARTDSWLMKALTGDEIGAYMARRLLPALVATPLVIGWLRLQGERTGLFSSEVGVALVATAYTVVFVMLVWLAARAANRSDARRRAAERAARESDERYRNLFSTMEEGFCIIEVVFDAQNRPVDYRFLEVNAAFEGQTGLHDATGKLMRDLAPDHEAHWFEIYGKVALTGEPVRFDNEAKALNRWYDVHAYRVGRPEDRRVAILFMDISDIKRAESALRRNEATLQGILDATRESIWLFSTDGVVLQANAIALTRFGKASPEVVGKSMEEILPPELARLRRARLQEVVETARLVEFEDERAGMQFRHSFYPVLDAEGRVTAVVSFSRDITESRRAEQALRVSEERFRAVAFNTPDHILVQDRELRYELVVNPQLGLTEQDMLGKTDYDFLSESDADRLTAMKRQVMQTGQPLHVEAPLTSAKGELELFDGTYVPRFDPQGRSNGVIGYFRNVTERKRAEQTLQESEERLRRLYSAMSEGLALHQMVYDDSGKATDYRLLDVNPAFEAITGISRDKAVGQLASELYGTGSPPYIDIYAKVAETAEPAEFETEFAPMAKCFHISVFSPGKGMFATVFADITERKHTERRIAEQATMLASANDAIIGYDADFRVTFWNLSADLMYGYSEAEAMGRASTEFLHPVYIGVTREQMVERISAEGHIEAESLRTTRDGRQLSIEAHVIALRDEQGGITGYVSVDRDITDRKRDEARVARLARLYAVLSRVNETIVRTRDAGTLYSEVCRIVSEEGRFPLTWVGLVDGKQVVPVACSGTACDYLKEVRIETEGELGNGPTGVSIREDRAVVNDDFAVNPATSPWRQPALRYGFQSSASFPLHRNGKVVGAFTLYASEPGEFDAEQVRLFEALSADVSYALDAIDQERLRAQAEEALRKAKEMLEVKVEERTAELTAEIDERKRAEERLTALSQYARSLIESSLDPLVTINAEGRITDVNEATIKVTGATRVELIGTDFCEYFTEPEKGGEGYRRVFAEGFVTDYPLTIRHRDGHLTDVLYNASVYRDAKGSVMGVFAAARDVTDQKQASQYARTLIESSLDPLVTISADGKVTDVNEATIKATGVPREQLVGTDFSNYFTEPEKARAGYRQVFAKGFVTDYPLTICHVDGHLTDVLYNATVYKDTRGNTIGVFAAARDVTDRKRAEAALQKAHDTLEVKVEERTAELKRSNEELEQFAYVASHDLQQPLRMVASYVALLAQRYKGQLDEKADKYIAYATNGAKHMQTLINDLLAFSRVGTRPIAFGPVELERVVGQARENLAAVISQSDAVVETGPLPVVSGDQTQLTQLFQNLLDNAIKFRGKEPQRMKITADYADCADSFGKKHDEPDISSPSRSPSGAISATSAVHAGSSSGPESVESAKSADIRSAFWVISVADNGIGIATSHQERIFKLFQRLHTEEEYPGTGIGLAVCKKIVERHGGTIRVESEPGKGATFIFTLPAADSGPTSGRRP